MKCLLGVIALSLFAVHAAAQSLPWTEDYGAPKNIQEIEPLNDLQYNWLYVLLFPAEIRNQYPNEAFKSFRVHLRDSYKKFPDPVLIEKKNLKLVDRIQGTMTYASIVKKKYVYDVLQGPQGEIIFNVRVHLKNATENDWAQFSEKIKEAQEIWNRDQIPVDFAYGFSFELVKDPKKAHFSVQVLDETRGPYDLFWGRNWTGMVIAHEVGHMMGLGDEYQTLSGTIDCYRPSLMCTAWTGSPHPHHYYFLLRRFL